MLTRKTILATLITLFLAAPGWAQSEGEMFLGQLPGFLQAVQTKAHQTETMLQMAQQSGNQQEMQRRAMEREMHQVMYAATQQALQNPQLGHDPAFRRQFTEALHEYNYRTEKGDMRPYDQIQPELAQYKAYVQWKFNTPEGQAYRQQTMNQMNANHQARMNSLQSQADARNNAWNQNQALQDNRHQQYIHGIYNEYQYVDPNSNQGYWVPMDNSNPAVVNPDGSYTPLVPYHNY